MSVRTTADEKLDQARQDARSAHKNLLQVLDDDTWGSSDFSTEFIGDIHTALIKLSEIKTLLK